MSEDSRNNTGIGFTIYLPGQATKAPPKPSDPTIPRLVRKDEPLPPDPEDAECREPPDDRWAAAARTIRNRTDELSQDCAFYPITSVTYSGSGDVDFEAHEPLVRSFDRGARAERVYISRVAQELLHGRYVYLLMNTSALVGWFDHAGNHMRLPCRHGLSRAARFPGGVGSRLSPGARERLGVALDVDDRPRVSLSRAVACTGEDGPGDCTGR
jgi:hypothetical protein